MNPHDSNPLHAAINAKPASVAAASAIRASWYDYPQYYDLAFRSETRPEADFIEAACRKYCSFTVRHLLEPACGTGRLIAELAARGYRMTGLDLSKLALNHLRRRLVRQGLCADVFRADMADFRPTEPVDAAYCTFSSFRHLLTEEAARRHLECVAGGLRPGGIYILGLHLLPRNAGRESADRWVERHGRTRISVTIRVLETDRRRRVETLRVNLLVRRGTQEVRLRDEYRLRLYTATQFRTLLNQVPCLEVCDVYDFGYNIDCPLRLNGEMSDSVFILKLRSDAF